MLRIAYLWSPVLLWLTVVAYLSAQPHIFITDIPYLAAAVKKLLGLDIHSYAHETLRQANFFFRKGLHVLVYLVFGFLLVRALLPTGLRRPTLVAVLIVAATAGADELNQAFNVTRSGQLSDVLIDTAGGLLGIGAYLAARRCVPHRCRPNSKPESGPTPP